MIKVSKFMSIKWDVAEEGMNIFKGKIHSVQFFGSVVNVMVDVQNVLLRVDVITLQS
ncbi:hypothetical protein [Peribacillus sp. ACCC06369]|uniref:hypothetical protein n=1 Tax=Peribacillus sp. ACCC06369 TaxID=3055860 RepID=UPI0025A014F1|nr:hypothetical protein [Peribacillus sp. ACCC06369]